MFVGFAVYFYYGIKHSSLEEEAEDDAGNIELSVAGPEAVTTVPVPAVPTVVTPARDNYPQPAWEPPADTPQQTSLNVQARNPLFVSTSKFPSWDD